MNCTTKLAEGVQKQLSNVTNSISVLWPEQSWSCTPETLDCDLPGPFVRSGICTLKFVVLRCLMFFNPYTQSGRKFCLWSWTWSSLWQAVLPLPPTSSKAVHSVLASCKLLKRFWSPARSPRFAANGQVGSIKGKVDRRRWLKFLFFRCQAHFRRSAWAGKDQQLLHCAKHSRHLPDSKDRGLRMLQCVNCNGILRWLAIPKEKRSNEVATLLSKENVDLSTDVDCSTNSTECHKNSQNKTTSAFYRFLNILEVAKVPRNVLDRLHQFAWDLVDSSELRIVLPSLDILPSYHFLQNSSKL